MSLKDTGALILSLAAEYIRRVDTELRSSSNESRSRHKETYNAPGNRITAFTDIDVLAQPGTVYIELDQFDTRQISRNLVVVGRKIEKSESLVCVSCNGVIHKLTEQQFELYIKSNRLQVKPVNSAPLCIATNQQFRGKLPYC